MDIFRACVIFMYMYICVCDLFRYLCMHETDWFTIN